MHFMKILMRNIQEIALPELYGFYCGESAGGACPLAPEHPPPEFKFKKSSGF